MAVKPDTVLRFIEDDQQELLNYQVQQKFLIPDHEGDLLRPSWKFAFYFIIRNLDPFPFGLSPLRLSAILIGCAVLMLGFFAAARWELLERLALQSGLPLTQQMYITCAAGAMIAGLLLGYLIQRRGFLWAGLIATLGVFVLIRNLFPNDWIIILIAAQAGMVGNRMFESKLTGTTMRLPGQFMVLLAMAFIGWYMISH